MVDKELLRVSELSGAVKNLHGFNTGLRSPRDTVATILGTENLF
jgi:hypothetical protein